MSEKKSTLFNPKGTLVYFTNFEISDSKLSPSDCLANLIETIKLWAESVYGAADVFDINNLEVSRDESLKSGSARVDIKHVSTNNGFIGQYSFMGRFFHGVETTTIRFHFSEHKRQLNISTHMFSESNLLSRFETPRESEKLCQLLHENSAFSLFIGGEKVTADVCFLSQSNLNDFVLTNSREEGQKLPIVISDLGESRDSDLEALNSRFFGMAHVVSVRRDATHERPTGRIFVKWRDSDVDDLTLENGFALASLYRKLVQQQMAKDSFTSRWFADYIKAINSILSEELSRGVESFNEAQLLRMELEESKQIAEFRGSNIDFEDFIGTFEQSHRAYKTAQSRYIVAIGELRSRLKDKFSVEEKELVINLSTESLEEIRSEFETLSVASNGAIIFTAHCVRTWGEALKRGYSDASVMETALIRLAMLSMDYASKRSAIGSSLVDYAKKKYSIEVIMGDRKLPKKEFLFEGKSFSQEPHLRADSGPTFDELGRVHFGIDQENSRLIVNVVGSKQYKNDK